MQSIFTGLTLREIGEVYKKIRPFIMKTPIIRSHYLEEILKKEVYLKLEYLQPTRSFKVRGALAKALSLDNHENIDGLVTASGGNHGLGVCYAGKELGIPVIVYLPEYTTKEKIDAISYWNGTPILYGEAWDESDIEAQRYAQELGLVYVHAFDDLAVVQGQGTIAFEMLEQQPALDGLLLSVGGGGLISGVGIVARQMKPEIKIFGVETEGADAVTQSFKLNKLVKLPAITSIAKTLGAKQTTEATFSRIKAVVNDMQTVTDQEALDALKFMLKKEKILVEPAASCIIAALMKNKFDLNNLKKLGIVLCGANVSLEELNQWNILS